MTTQQNNNGATQMNFFENLGNQSFDEAKKIVGENKYPDLFLVQVKQAVLNQSENGVITLDIALNICDEETKAEKRTINMETFFLTGKNGEQKDNHIKNLTKVNNLRYLLNPDMPEKTAWKRELAPAKVWDKETKAFDENKMVMQLTDIVGKYFWAIIGCYHNFPSVLVNGYSRTPITDFKLDPVAHNQERMNEETIFVPDYSAKRMPSFALWGMYDLNTKQSLAERLDGKEPVEINDTLKNILEKAEKGEFTEPELSGDAEIKERKAILGKKLGKSFDAKRWADSNSASAMAYSSSSHLF